MEKRKFIIPSAADVANLDKVKPKVKSYFKAQKDVKKSDNNNACSSKALSTSVAQTTGGSTSNRANAGKPSPLPDVQNILNTDASSSDNKTSSIVVTHGCSDDTNMSSEPSTSSTALHQVQSSASISNKIGSGFAAKFGALKETSEYEEPKVVEKPTVKAPDMPVVNKKPVSSNCLVVHPKQRGNPILKHVRNVPYEFSDIVPDYIMGKTSCALFLSLRYHLLNPNYIYGRLKSLANMFELRLLLVQVDIKDPGHPLKDLAKMAILADCTLLLAWSAEEAGRYLETYKSYENKSADTLKERVQSDFTSKMTDCLTTIKSVNKTDALTLLTTFGTFEGIVNASEDELAFCPGFGPNKAKRVAKALKEPFRKNKRSKVMTNQSNAENIQGTSTS